MSIACDKVLVFVVVAFCVLAHKLPTEVGAVDLGSLELEVP